MRGGGRAAEPAVGDLVLEDVRVGVEPGFGDAAAARHVRRDFAGRVHAAAEVAVSALDIIPQPASAMGGTPATKDMRKVCRIGSCAWLLDFWSPGHTLRPRPPVSAAAPSFRAWNQRRHESTPLRPRHRRLLARGRSVALVCQERRLRRRFQARFERRTKPPPPARSILGRRCRGHAGAARAARPIAAQRLARQRAHVRHRRLALAIANAAVDAGFDQQVERHCAPSSTCLSCTRNRLPTRSVRSHSTRRSTTTPALRRAAPGHRCALRPLSAPQSDAGTQHHAGRTNFLERKAASAAETRNFGLGFWAGTRRRRISAARPRLVLQRAVRARIDPGELRAQQEDLRRVVDPHQHHHQRARRAIARSDAALADVEPDEVLADREQQRRDAAPVQTSRHSTFTRGMSL